MSNSTPPTTTRKDDTVRTAIVVGACVVAMFAVMAACTAAEHGTGADTAPVISTISPTDTPTAAKPTREGVPVDLSEPKVIARDIKLTSCKLGQFDTVRTTLTLVNKAAKPQSFIVHGEVVDKSGGRIGQWTASTTHLAPDQQVRMSGIGNVEFEGRFEKPIKCRVVQLSRF